jgi:hypothetical protein
MRSLTLNATPARQGNCPNEPREAEHVADPRGLVTSTIVARAASMSCRASPHILAYALTVAALVPQRSGSPPPVRPTACFGSICRLGGPASIQPLVRWSREQPSLTNPRVQRNAATTYGLRHMCDVNAFMSKLTVSLSAETGNRRPISRWGSVNPYWRYAGFGVCRISEVVLPLQKLSSWP